MALKFINDGMTLPGYIAAVVGEHEALRFRFRPAMAPERIEYRNQVALPGQAKQAVLEMFKGHLISWEDPSPCTPENAVKIDPPDVAEKLLLIILGYRNSDPEPAAPTVPTPTPESTSDPMALEAQKAALEAAKQFPGPAAG